MGNRSSHSTQHKQEIMVTVNDIEMMYDRQLPSWQLVGDNYAALEKMMVREMVVNGCNMVIQYNPCRSTSVTANINKSHERPCFLCDHNLPTEQLRISLWDKYQVLVNPYPLFKHHYTIASTIHTPQRIAGRVNDMLQMSKCFAPYTLFYNGPYSGASAPMHMHFQASEEGYMPIEKQWKTNPRHEVMRCNNTHLSYIEGLLRPIFVIEGADIEEIERLFNTLYKVLFQLPHNKDCEEPMMNLMLRWEENHYIMLIFPRSKHRPDCYYANDATRLLISPGSVEMGGIFVTIDNHDFATLTPENVIQIYREVTPSQEDIYHIINTLSAL